MYIYIWIKHYNGHVDLYTSTADALERLYNIPLDDEYPPQITILCSHLPFKQTIHILNTIKPPLYGLGYKLYKEICVGVFRVSVNTTKLTPTFFENILIPRQDDDEILENASVNSFNF